MTTINTDHYRYQVTWSEPDGEYVGLVDEFPSLSWLDEDQAEAFAGIRRLVAEVVEDMEQSGEVPPTPKSDRKYSGTFLVRTTPDVHGGVVALAEHRKVSLNGFVAQLLEVVLNNPEIIEAQVDEQVVGNFLSDPADTVLRRGDHRSWPEGVRTVR